MGYRISGVFAVVGLLLVLVGLSSRGRAQDEKDPYARFLPKTGPQTPADEQKKFRLPPGFEIQLVAAEPDIHKPINLAFDHKGRLWVTDTVEYPFPAKEGTKTRDTLKVLEDFDAAGKARKVTTFADQLNIPIGVLPITPPSPPLGKGGTGGCGAIVFSIPYIWKMLDTNGDGVADKREVLYSKFGYNDTHGMSNSYTWGFDGWIYGCHGFSNTSTVKGSDGKEVKFTSGNTYRFKPDGSHIEYFTHGQVNPFGICFDPLGNLYSADCHSDPLYMLLRGADYPHFGKLADSFGFGPQMCFQDHGSTAIAGCVYYAADHFPPEYRDTIFIGNPMTNRINHDRLEEHGSTPKSVLQPDFLICDDPWFRPVDLKLGPDGALYVADFYNAIIGHYEFPLTHPARDKERGRIWRIVYRGPDGKGQAKLPRADWSTATDEELIQDLGHANLNVRIQATNEIVRNQESGVRNQGSDSRLPTPDSLLRLVRKSRNALQRAHALWALERLGVLDDDTLKIAAGDKDRLVRVHALRILGERTSFYHRHHQPLLAAGLKDADPFVQRAAADALGRHPDPANIRPLLDLRHQVPSDDTHLRHVVRMALRDQLRDGEAFADFPTKDEKDVRALADAASGVTAPAAAEYLAKNIRFLTADQSRLIQYVRHIARYGTPPAIETLLAFAQDHEPGTSRQQVALAKAFHQGTQERGSRLNRSASAWIEALTERLLASSESDKRKSGIELAGTIKLKSAKDRLAELAGQKDVSNVQRQEAVTAMVAIDPKKSVSVLARLLQDGSEPIAFREHLARQLVGVNLPEAQEELIKALIIAPKRLQVTIAGVMANNPKSAEALLDAVAGGRVSPRLLQELPNVVHIIWANNPAHARNRERYQELTRGLSPADDKIQTLLNQRLAAFNKAQRDVGLGAKVFEKNCAICHQIANKGAKVGPQLDGVGVRGADRLIEDLLDPSRNVDQAFRTTTLETKGGQVFAGLLLKEEGEALVLADNQGKEVRFAKNEIEQRGLSPLSPMPANVVDQIPEKDFYDLLAFLMEQKPTDAGKTGAARP